MLKKYDKFIKDFQQKIDKYFEENSEYIYCHEGCSACCEIGEYPFSWIEMGYLMEAFVELPENIKQNLNIDVVLKDFDGEMGEIRPIIEWI